MIKIFSVVISIFEVIDILSYLHYCNQRLCNLHHCEEFLLFDSKFLTVNIALPIKILRNIFTGKILSKMPKWISRTIEILFDART